MSDDLPGSIHFSPAISFYKTWKMAVPIQEVIFQRPIMAHIFGASSRQCSRNWVWDLQRHRRTWIQHCLLAVSCRFITGFLGFAQIPSKKKTTLEGSILFSHRFKQPLNRSKWSRFRGPLWAWWKPPCIVLTNFTADRTRPRPRCGSIEVTKNGSSKLLPVLSIFWY